MHKNRGAGKLYRDKPETLLLRRTRQLLYPTRRHQRTRQYGVVREI